MSRLIVKESNRFRFHQGVIAPWFGPFFKVSHGHNFQNKSSYFNQMNNIILILLLYLSCRQCSKCTGKHRKTVPVEIFKAYFTGTALNFHCLAILMINDNLFL